MCVGAATWLAGACRVVLSENSRRANLRTNLNKYSFISVYSTDFPNVDAS